MISIIANEEKFVVINKPSGVEMHHPQYGVCNLLKKQLQLDEIFLVHRLDKATSGCMVLAKTSKTASMLAQQFAQGQVSKYYIALSSQKPKKKQGKISGYMCKSRNGSFMLARQPPSSNDNTDGIRVKGSHSPSLASTFFLSESDANTRRLFYLKPISGKTHQLRVALKSLGSPILGDTRYKGKQADRLYLHSWQLEFCLLNKAYCYHSLPETGEYFTSALLQNLKSPLNLPWPKASMLNNKANLNSEKNT